MNQWKIVQGSKIVVITQEAGLYSCRLYEDGGRTVTLRASTNCSRSGIERSALRLLAQ